MARDDGYGDEPRSTAKTSRAMQTTTHNASGGHTKGPGLKPGSRNQIIKPPLWDNTPDGDSGGVMYVFNEYPKHVTVEGKLFVCNSEAEEQAACDTGKIVREADERKRLVTLAEVKGVQVDGRWSLDKMSKALTDAGYDATQDPFDGQAK